MEYDLFNRSVPLGLGMSLAQNTTALARFSQMSEEQRQAVISGAQEICSHRQMQSYVRRLAEQGEVPGLNVLPL